MKKLDPIEEARFVERMKKIYRSKSSAVLLPFLNINTEKLIDFYTLPKKLENSKNKINHDTDLLLITGFEGDEEDFNRCYKRHQQVKLNKIVKQKNFDINKLLIKDDCYGPIKLTKIKEFNFTKKNFRYFRNTRNMSSSNFFSKSNSNIINSNSFLNTNSNNQINNSSCVRGGYFFLNKSTIIGDPYYKEKVKNINKLISIRNMLKTTTTNLDNINTKLKHFSEKKLKIYDIGTNKENNKNIPKKMETLKEKKNLKKNYKKLFDAIKEEENMKKNSGKELSDILGPLRKGGNSTLKQIKKDDGFNSHNIWMKKSTANMVIFGKAFQSLEDETFYRQRKRIVERYPEIEKEADLQIPVKNKVKDNKNIFKIMSNSRKINDLFYNNEVLLKNLIHRNKSYQVSS